jgi:hypothetical protein
VAVNQPVPAGASGLLRGLASGVTLQEAGARRAADPPMRRAGSVDPKPVVELAAQLAYKRELSPPAKAAFLAAHPEARPNFEHWPQRAHAVLAALLSEGSARLTDETRLALQYAAAVVQQQEILQALATVNASSAPRHAALPGPDRDRVENYLLYIGMPSGIKHTVDRIVDTWAKLVGIMEVGDEHWYYEEHVNWLVARDHLAVVLSLLSWPPRTALEAEVRALDDRFAAATAPLSTTIERRDPWRPRGWWWFRRPKTLNLDFRKRLERLSVTS